MDIIAITNLIILAILIVLTAFFVASEFAVVKVRMSRIDQLVSEGNKKAKVAQKVASNLDYYLSACQLGITVTALGLGAIGKPAVERLMYPVFDLLDVSEATASIASYAIAFLLVTFLHVVIGEMAPKTLAIQFAEKMTLMLASPLYWFGKIMYPFIWSLNGTSRVLLRLFGIKPAGHEDVYSEDEIRIIMAQSYKGGQITETKLEYMDNVFTFDERVTKDIMVPRTDLITLDKGMQYSDIIQILDENNYTRYPITEDGNKDRIIGVVNIKKMLPHIVAGRPRKLEQFIRTLPIVFEYTPIHEAMIKMQQERVHMALVIDEYGGTSGVLTMEDILEEIVGEIRDEFDSDELADIQQISELEYVISGRARLDDIESRFDFHFENLEDIDTIGGWIQYHKGTTVRSGDQIAEEHGIWTVRKTKNMQIKQVAFKRTVNSTE